MRPIVLVVLLLASTPRLATGYFQLLGAQAHSSTSVDLQFSTPIDGSTASTDQFAMDFGSVNAASATGAVVTLTTSTLTANQTYHVTVGPGLRDVNGDAIDPTHNSAAFVVPAAAVPDETQGFSLRLVSPCPSLGRFAVAFRLPDAHAATLDVFDMAGRRLESHEVGDLGAGSHRLATHETAAPGLYLVRLRSGAAMRMVRAVVVR